jgi:hypothetical protein
MAAMPTARGGFGVAVVAGKIYAIGGINENNVPLSITEEYNPVTNSWTTKTAMPTPRSGFAVAVYNNKIYAIGGTVGNGYVGNNEMYDPLNNRWETKTSMPTPRADLCANTVNDIIYLIGGEKYSNINPYYIETNVNEAYNPANDTWTTKTPLPTAVQGHGSAVIENKIHIIGGSKQPTSTGNTMLVNNNQVYDPQTDQWSTAKVLPMVASYGVAAATEGYLAPQRIYYLGGFSGDSLNTQTEMFNAAMDSWSTVDPMPTPREYLGVAVVNDVLYAVGGFDGTNWLNTNEQFKPVGYGSVPPIVQITSPENKTYTDVPLTFAVNRGTEWIGYSLDNQANVTIKTQTTLSGLSQGAHKITIFANDSAGNMGVSNTVHFSVDTLAPRIVILSPANQSYGSTDIELTFIIDEAAALTYSLDGSENMTLSGNVTLPALSNGGHRLTIYAVDAMGNSAQETVYFDIAPFPFVIVVAALVIIIIVVAAIFLLYKYLKTAKNKPPRQKSQTTKES